MEINYKKTKKTSLKEENLNETWLQDQINKDPSILGLGEIIILKKESPKRSAPIDFLTV